MPNQTPDHLSPTARSALWAAWADALGFQTELAGDKQQLQRRIGAEQVEGTSAWRRRIGGRFGVQVDLPAGTYSDDTQLRLAVCRCIRASGRFDIEAFSKIELSVFLSYELGAGLGTKAAANALGKRSVRWNSNFFSSKRSAYIEGGGNGAAMRIQPHVWAASDLRPAVYLPAAISDAVTTHGHPRGILGAALHGLAVGSVLREEAVPEPRRWSGMVDYLRRVPAIMSEQDALAERWLPLWEQHAGRSWLSAVTETVDELERQVQIAADLAQHPPGSEAELYAELCERLGGLAPKTRGCGTLAAVLSLWLAWRHQDNAAEGLRIAANLVGSDTDTVATMAGALLGPVTDQPLPGALLDHDLHIREAQRLERLRTGEPVEDFPHPDPLHWQQPATLADAVGLLDDELAVAGLGTAKSDGVMIPGPAKDGTGWQWLETAFGQHMLVKRRQDLAHLPDWSRPRHRATTASDEPLTLELEQSPLERLPRAANRRARDEHGLPDEVEEAVAQVVASDFESGRFMLLYHHLVRLPYGATKAGLFATIVAERLREREGLAAAANGGARARDSARPSARRRS